MKKTTASLLIAGIALGSALTASTAANAADCAGPELVTTYNVTLSAEASDTSPGPSLPGGTTLCVTGALVPYNDLSPNYGHWPVMTTDGRSGYVTSHGVAEMPDGWDNPSFTGHVIVPPKGLQLSLWSAVGDAKVDAIYALPSAALGTNPIRELVEGEVLAVDPNIKVMASAGLADAEWVIVRLEDGSTGWTTTASVALLPAADAPLTEEWTPQRPAGVWNDPSLVGSTEPDYVIEPGATVEASAESGNFRRVEDGFAQVPPLGDSTPSWWDRTKEKASELWDKAKEKTSDVVDAAKDKGSELKEKATDNEPGFWAKAMGMPAFVAATVLGVLALILTALGLGLRKLLPVGVRWVRVAFVPLAVLLGAVAVTIAPAAWAWMPWAALGVALIPAAAGYTWGKRLHGRKTKRVKGTIAELAKKGSTWVVAGPAVAIGVAAPTVAVVAGFGSPLTFVVMVAAALAVSLGWMLNEAKGKGKAKVAKSSSDDAPADESSAETEDDLSW